MADIKSLQISYPDFRFGEVIDPEQIDANNSEVMSKINEVIPIINTNKINSDNNTSIYNALNTSMSQYKTDITKEFDDTKNEFNTLSSEMSQYKTDISTKQDLLEQQQQQVIANATSDSEVQDGRISFDAKSFATIGAHIRNIGSLVNSIYGNINGLIINVLYPPNGLTPAKGDGITDDSPALQGIADYIRTKNGGVMFIPEGIYKMDTALTLYHNTILTGYSIETTILKPSTGVDCIHFMSNVKFTQIKNLLIIAETYTNGTYGIKYDEDLGGSQNLIQNIVITDFEIGIYVRDSWFDNYVKQVRINNAKHSLYMSYKTGGSTINNTFDNIYIDKPKNYPIVLSSTRRIIFNNPSIDLTTFPTAMQISTNCEVTFIGGNLEASELASGQSIVEILSSSTVTFIGTRLAPHTAQSNSYGFNVTGVDSRIVLINCICDKIPNITQVRTAYKDRQVIVNLSPQIDNFVNSSGSGGGAMYKNLMSHEIKQSIEIDLSENAVDYPVLFSTQTMSLISAKILYTENTSSDLGIDVSLKNSFYTYATAKTEPNKTAFSTTDMTISKTQIVPNEPLRIACNGGKTGLGKCVIELSYWVE